MRNLSRQLFLLALLTGLGVVCQAQQAGGEPKAAVPPGESNVAPPYGAPITLAQAEKVIAAGKAEAVRLKYNVNVIAVVDTHGELVAFAKMDDATIHSIAFAQVKASGAARLRRITATPPVELAAALTAMPDFVSMPGGIPIVVAGKTIGAVGVSGGDDVVIAKAAIKALQ